MSKKAVRGYKALQKATVYWVHAVYESIDNGNSGAGCRQRALEAQADLNHAVTKVLMAAGRVAKVRSAEGWTSIVIDDLRRTLEALEQHAPKVVQPPREK